MAARIVLYAAGALIIAPMFVQVLASVLADLAMLVDAYGVFGVAIFSAPTVAPSRDRLRRFVANLTEGAE